MRKNFNIRSFAVFAFRLVFVVWYHLTCVTTIAQIKPLIRKSKTFVRRSDDDGEENANKNIRQIFDQRIPIFRSWLVDVHENTDRAMFEQENISSLPHVVRANMCAAPKRELNGIRGKTRRHMIKPASATRHFRGHMTSASALEFLSLTDKNNFA